MDDRTFYRIVVGSLGVAAFGIFLDYLSKSFNVPGGLWGFLSAVLAALGGRSVAREMNGRRRGEKRGDDEPS